MVGGLLIGMGFSIYFVVRKATKLKRAGVGSATDVTDGDTGGGSTAPKQKRD